MVWTGTSTYLIPITLKPNGVLVTSTVNAGYSTELKENAAISGGILLTTGTDVVKIPINSKNGKMVMFVEYNGFIYPGAIQYPTICLRHPSSTGGVAWGAKCGGTSTQEGGWDLITTTQSLMGATSESASAVFGPFDTAVYAHNYGSSTEGIAAGQSYFECMFSLSTGMKTGDNSTSVCLGNSTTLMFMGASLTAYELP